MQRAGGGHFEQAGRLPTAGAILRRAIVIIACAKSCTGCSHPGLNEHRMIKNSVLRRIVECLLCAWALGAQLWYASQFRPLAALFARKVLHRE